LRIELYLPDWVEDKHLYIMAGIELAAYKHVNKPWMVKIGRCDMCGKCCMELKDGPCEHLKADGKKWVCGLGLNRPWRCCVSVGQDCAERFEEWAEQHHQS